LTRDKVIGNWAALILDYEIVERRDRRLFTFAVSTFSTGSMYVIWQTRSWFGEKFTDLNAKLFLKSYFKQSS
jgi:hypothetical protein